MEADSLARIVRVAKEKASDQVQTSTCQAIALHLHVALTFADGAAVHLDHASKFGRCPN